METSLSQGSASPWGERDWMISFDPGNSYHDGGLGSSRQEFAREFLKGQ
jgi:hypothetical protein